MRKITVISMITLDGVMQAPGGKKEDTSNGFKYGGWTAHYGDEAYGKAIQKELTDPVDYILGRKTYQIWAGYWPQHADFWPQINSGMKYVISKKLKSSDKMITGWANSQVIRTAADIKKLKKSKGHNIQVWGSSVLMQLLLKHDLIDEMRLIIHPLTLRKGKKLFGDGTIPAAFTMADSVVTTKGVIIATYKRDGKVKTGNVGA